jgi:hypothetical protein
VVAASGVRINWMQIPVRVRAGIEAIIGGGAVIAAVSQSGGFSPGTADRVVTADGRRAFVKAVSSTQNEQSPSLHRAEAHVVGQLPSTSFVPALLGVYDDGAWVGLTTPRSWCGTTWRVSTATTSRPHWRVFVDISPVWPASRPIRAFPPRFSTRTSSLDTELAAQALPNVNHNQANQRTPEMGCIRAPTWCRHAFRQEHVTCTATACETKPTPRCLSAEFAVEDA